MPQYFIIEEDGSLSRESLRIDGCPKCGTDKGVERPEAKSIRIYRRSSPPFPTQFEVDCRECGYLGDLDGIRTFGGKG